MISVELYSGWIPLAAILLFGVGCGSDRISEEEANTYVDEWAAQAERSLQDQVDVLGAEARFQKLAERAADETSDDVRRDEPPYDVFVRDAYSSAGWKLRLTSREGWTDQGRAVWELVLEVDRHAIDKEAFEFEQIRKRLERVQALTERIDEMSAYEPSEEEKRRAREWLVEQNGSDFELEPDNFDRLARAVAETEAGERLKEKMAEIEELFVERANAVAKLELLAARNTGRYARKMKHFRVRHLYIHERQDDYWRNPFTDGERPDEQKGPFVAGTVRRRAAEIADEIREPTEILHRRIRTTLEDVLTNDEPGSVLRDLEPQQPQYSRLAEAYERYRSIVEEGGWEEVPKERNLGPGDTGETVAALQERLQIEGYYPDEAPIDESFGDDLESAVESYQETHQMEATGEPHEMFWSSLNKSAEWRTRQVGLNLQRWRESDIRHSDPIYVLVNIPGAHLEVWDNQKRKMRFRVVVGNDTSEYDPEEQKTVHPNHTPEVSAYIDRVIYNPYWNITDRIRETEILPKARRSVEEKYRAKLREMRRKKQRLEESNAGPLGARAEGLSDEETSAIDRLLVARSSEGPADESGGETDSESAAESAASDDSGDEESNGVQSGHSGSKKEVDIDDLYRMVEDQQSRIDEIDHKAVFDVEKIRKLIVETRRLSENDTSASTGDEEGLMGGMAETEPSEGGESSGDETSSEGQEEEASPLEKTFPYLDPETGEVDVSTTDPDNVPAWYAENNYEVMHPGKEWEYVRMDQGNSNALGRVKVIFPNRHDIYLHDTPKEKLFDREIRAFSHGCMRMDEPLGFAKYLLERDGTWSEIDVDSLLNERVRKEDESSGETEWSLEYRPVFLDEEVPVYVEYFTARVDKKGRTHFYADVYGKDAEQLGED